MIRRHPFIPSRRPPNRRPLGFTLVELLVATTLLSIVMSSVYTLTHSSLRTWHFAEGSQDLHLEARNALTLFTHEYNNIVGKAEHLFEGDEKEITMFVTAQPMDVEQGEGPRLMRVTYSYNRTRRTVEREEALVQTALPRRPTGEREIDRSRVRLGRRHKTTIAENVAEFKLTYIWVPLPEEQRPEEPPVVEPPIYKDSHQALWGLPQGVRFELKLRASDGRDQDYDISVTLPMRAPMHRRRREQLEDLFSV